MAYLYFMSNSAPNSVRDELTPNLQKNKKDYSYFKECVLNGSFLVVRYITAHSSTPSHFNVQPPFKVFGAFYTHLSILMMHILKLSSSS